MRDITAILPWFGSKRTDAHRIARECCPGGKPPKSFWDLCCGSLTVSLAMPACAHHHAVELHGDLINVAHVIQDETLGPQFYRKVRRILHHEDFFHEHRALIEAGDGGLFGEVSQTPLARAVSYFVVSWQGRNGVSGTERVRYQMAKRWTSGGGHGAVRYRGAVDSIPGWRRRLRSISVVSDDIFRVLVKLEDQPGTVIYLDPPYVRDRDTRSSATRYQFDWTIEKHRKCRELLGRFKRVRIVVSYYDCEIIRELYQGWTFVDLARQKNLHAQNKRGAAECIAPEILVINGPSFT